MELKQAIEGRRSIRKFKSEKVSEEVIKKIVGEAAFAPSWKNTQITRYIVVDDEKIKEEIADDCVLGFSYNTGTIKAAPQLFVVTGIDGRSGIERDGTPTTSKGASWMMFDAGIAVQTLCLAAYEEGVGTVIMGIFDPDKVGKLVGVPQGQTVIAIVAFGYPDEQPNAPKRKSAEDLVSFR